MDMKEVMEALAAGADADDLVRLQAQALQEWIDEQILANIRQQQAPDETR